MWNKSLAHAALVLVACLLPADMARGQSSKTLTLADCIDSALRQNLGLMVQRYTPPSAVADLEIAKAEFDPQLGVGAVVDQSRQAEATSELEGSETPENKGRDATASLNKKISSGADLGIHSGLTRAESDSSFATLNPSYDAEIGASIRQPLLKGAGSTVTLANITRGRILVSQSGLSLRGDALDVARDTELAYWQLVVARQEQVIREASLRVAEQILAEAKARLDAGVSTRVDVLESEADMASKKEALIVAAQNAADAEDRLLVLAGRFADAGATMQLSDALPRPGRENPDEASSIERARTDQPEYLIQKDVIRQHQLDLAVAKHERNPELDLNASGSYLGRDSESGQSYDQAFNGDGYRWQVDLTLSVPWGLREEKARYTKAHVSLAGEQARLDQLDEDLRARIRAACRAIRSNRERVAAAAAARKLREQQVDQEKARFESGQVTARDVLNIQEDLDDARLSELKAMNDSVASEVLLARMEGSLFSRYGLAWNEVVDQLGVPEEDRPVKTGGSK